ncbi:MBL fold metallo-hydrolase [Beijerinckia indica]|uniref:Beta-lactamase domain protein n=1 Tax=Beijerinckia indica subsp. indica (strain ATCC 9039 / DSM 1715 / NCIMB 8712) TaxID=395963 RepID=B2IEG6_BEII9|nr:MBL fold metallo-hydrolase [Beijerinckia indica]ACB95564.1 beta-lactamase domain protein [Beijerinckia indica subsp. indica ATCC 9039]
MHTPLALHDTLPASADKPLVEAFYDSATGSIQYVVVCPVTRACAIIDPVLDFDEKSGSIATRNADAILDYIRKQGLQVAWILDTHPHADHFSASFYLKTQTGAPMGIGDHVTAVQSLWRDIYNWPDFPADGSQWDRLFKSGDSFQIGNLEVNVILSPGHTPASITYLIGNAVFVHDTLFMPDSGTARADFPGGNAALLWQSIQTLLTLPDETRVFTGHDYPPVGRQASWESTIGEQKRHNIHVTGKTESDFIALRHKRDSGLPLPHLLLPALQVNINAGQLPPPEDNQRHYLKIPIGAFPGAVW